MKSITQINHLRTGVKNQITNPAVTYDKHATSHVGPAGTNHAIVGTVTQQLMEEHPDTMTIELWGHTMTLKANFSLSRKSCTWSAVLPSDLARPHFVSLSQKGLPHIYIHAANSIEITNGGKGYIAVCPSLITIK